MRNELMEDFKSHNVQGNMAPLTQPHSSWQRTSWNQEITGIIIFCVIFYVPQKLFADVLKQ